MGKKKIKKIKKSSLIKTRKIFPRIDLPPQVKRWAGGVIMFLLAIIVGLSFFQKAGIAGKAIFSVLNFLIGNATFLFPFIFVLSGLVFFISRYERLLGPVILAIFLLILGISGIINCLNSDTASRPGGWIGYYATLPFSKFFGLLVTQILFTGIIVISALIFWYLLKQPRLKTKEALKAPKEAKAPSSDKLQEDKQQSFIKRIFAPKFKVGEVPSVSSGKLSETSLKTSVREPKQKEAVQKALFPKSKYERPPIELLDSEGGLPSAGDIRQNSAIIKKTLENFSIPVEMSEINIGPTVTQYALKPADGIKLSKITVLSDDLALSLAAHPIRIEAPIPGKSLVGVEVPNKIRARVRIRELISNAKFQNSPSHLSICLGKDVSGSPIYADLARMPHLLVAGATGTGKTIFLNNLIISLLYRNSPETLRFIMIDPKRVEFPVYHELPHLLSQVILDPNRSVNALKWLVGEMERRFGVLAAAKSRDIGSYNDKAVKNEEPLLPYIVVVVDELADLMAAKGKDIEAGIVRLAQMARAVGIHLVLATQRPSVEVITGLIKANVTSRVSFQVASQVDSRTILDMAGSEKLLGLGDMLFVSAEFAKPRRIQGAYISDKEVKRVTDYIKAENAKIESEKGEEDLFENGLASDLEKSLDSPESETENFYSGEDLLFEEAKRVVTEARKASASLLQRRLRIGYARAARLIDMLEEGGVVGPGEGAKPREVLMGGNNPSLNKEVGEEEEDGDDWKKV